MNRLIRVDWKSAVNSAAVTALSLALAMVAASAPRGSDKGTSWDVTEWADGDHTFRDLRSEFSAYTDRWTGFQNDAAVSAKAVDAGRAFSKSPDKPRLLYRATALYIAAYSLDPVFQSDPRSTSICGQLERGWRSILAQPNYEFSRMGFIFGSDFMNAGNLDDLGLALLRRDPDDAVVARAYINMAMNRMVSPEDCRERCVRLGDKLVASDPARPANWLARATAHWVHAFGRAGGARTDFEITSQCIGKYQAMLPPDHPHHKQLELWKRGIKNALKYSK